MNIAKADEHYEELERKHLGDIDKGAGIYAPKIEEVKHERDELAKAIRDAAVKAGIIRPGTNLTGPMLLMLCDNLADMAVREKTNKKMRSRNSGMEM